MIPDKWMISEFHSRTRNMKREYEGAMKMLMARILPLSWRTNVTGLAPWITWWFCVLCLLRYFPFGIIFLVAGKILDMQDPSTLGKKLGWYGITVLTGLFVHGLILLPLFYFLLTRKNPFSYIRGLLQAMVIALATSSRLLYILFWQHTWSESDASDVASYHGYREEELHSQSK